MSVIDIDDLIPWLMPTPAARCWWRLAPTTRSITRCGGTTTNAGVRLQSGPTRATERRRRVPLPRRDTLHGQRPRPAPDTETGASPSPEGETAVPRERAAAKKTSAKKATAKKATAKTAATKKAAAKKAVTKKAVTKKAAAKKAVVKKESTQASTTEAPEAASGPVGGDIRNDVELPEKISEGRPSAEASERALVRKPQIGDTMPVPSTPPPGRAQNQDADSDDDSGDDADAVAARSGAVEAQAAEVAAKADRVTAPTAIRGSRRQRRAAATRLASPMVRASQRSKKRGRGRGGKGRSSSADEQAMLEQRKGRERNGKPIGRYFMCVQVRPGMAQVAVLEGRNLIEHYVSRPADDVAQIHGNIYVGKVQNVLPGMEAAFVDIATPKNAVLYRGDVQYDPADIEVKGKNPRIEDILKNKQLILCQVTKNPIAHKGARLTQEVSLPGRFVVLIPNSKTYGISKRLPDDVRKRLRNILDRVKPDEHGLIVRTAAEHATEDELVADMTILLKQWEQDRAEGSQGAASGAAVARTGAGGEGHP